MKVIFFPGMSHSVDSVYLSLGWKVCWRAILPADVKCTDVLEGERNAYDISIADTFIRMASYKNWLNKLEKIQINLKAILERLYEVAEQGIQWSRWTLGMWQVASGDKSLLSLTSSHFSFKLGLRKVKRCKRVPDSREHCWFFLSIQQLFASVMPQHGQQLCEISNADF